MKGARSEAEAALGMSGKIRLPDMNGPETPVFSTESFIPSRAGILSEP